MTPLSKLQVGVLLSKIKKIPKNTNGRLAIPALAGLLVHVSTEWFTLKHQLLVVCAESLQATSAPACVRKLVNELSGPTLLCFPQIFD